MANPMDPLIRRSTSAVLPAVGPQPAAVGRTASGAFAAVPAGGRTLSGKFPAVPAPDPAGRTSSGRFPAVMPVPRSASGSFPAVAAPDPNARTASGRFAAVAQVDREETSGEQQWRQEMEHQQLWATLVEEVRTAANLRIDSEQPIDATLPPVSLQIHRLAGDPNTDIRAVSKLVAQDPPLAGRLMELANSSFYQRASPARTLDDAVLRLGLGAIRNMLILPSLKTRLLRNPTAEGLWEHATTTAVAAPFLAALAGLQPDLAFLAGLLHDVGRILLWLEGDRSPLGQRPGFARAVDELHAGLGAQLVLRWRIDVEVAHAVHGHDRPGDDATRLAHLVNVAERVAHTLDPNPVPFDPAQNLSVRFLKLPVPPVRALVERLPRLVAEQRL